ncbi:hypothetical protein JTB14_002021 [Gonioctena quinquepunctata]|nr:hypothetical protein JTB14_002021 [Gonioctena quinquepunctata]
MPTSAQQAEPCRIHSSELTILQANLGRARAAHDLAHITAVDKNIDILVISEPNKALAGKPGWITDKNNDAAIHCTNKNIPLKRIKKMKGWVRLETINLLMYS